MEKIYYVMSLYDDIYGEVVLHDLPPVPMIYDSTYQVYEHDYGNRDLQPHEEIRMVRVLT